MDLETFISQSLVQIARGIEKANDELKGSQAIISPKDVVDIQKGNSYGSLKINDGSWVAVQEITFDVAVTVSQGSEAKGGAGISVGAITLGATGKEDNQNTSVSRIKFNIPMLLPQKKQDA